MNELIKLSLKEKIRIYEISTKQDYIKIEKLQDIKQCNYPFKRTD